MRKTEVAVIFKFKDDWKTNIYHPGTKEDAEKMVIQLKSNPEIEYAIISDDTPL